MNFKKGKKIVSLKVEENRSLIYDRYIFETVHVILLKIVFSFISFREWFTSCSFSRQRRTESRNVIEEEHCSCSSRELLAISLERRRSPRVRAENPGEIH